MNIGQLISLAESINTEITKQAAQIWPGFAPVPFILYDDKIRVAVGTDWPESYTNVRGDIWVSDNAKDGLFGCTACNYHGRIVAIWDIRTWGKQIDMANCVGNVVHEMFHAFQHKFSATNWGNEFALLDFRHTPRAVALLMAERRVMSGYLQGTDTLSAFQKIAELRAKREHEAGKEIVLIDKTLETAEGMAYYVEIKTSAKVRNTKPALYDANLTSFTSEMLTNYRARCYTPGAVFCLMADELTPGWHSDWAKSGKHIFDWLTAHVSNTAHGMDIFSDDLQIAENLIDDFNLEKKKSIDKFLSQPLSVHDKNIEIMSLDPMNIICHENICLHKRAVQFKIDGAEQLIPHPVAHKYGEHLWDIKEIYIPN
ncbi:MAG: hypothetical protein FWC95_05360 [Defluviitaleaceae bacterium]|nr:hypothetical protein [Defluviitaleaceae bacterium]